MTFESHDFLAAPNTICSSSLLGGCGRPIRFVRLNGRAHPIDPDPNPERGTIAVVEPETGRSAKPVAARARILLAAERQTYEGNRYVSHFATCPLAERFRSKKA